MSITKTGVLIDTNSTFPNPSTFEVLGEQTSVRVTGLSLGQTYYAKGFVIEDGNTIYSTNVMSFQTQARVVDYLTFTNTSNSANTLELHKYTTETTPQDFSDIVLQYSINNGVWTTWESAYGDLSISIPVGGNVRFRGDNQTFSCGTGVYVRGWYQFSSSNDIVVSGKLTTLIDSTGTQDSGVFMGLFKDMTHLDTNNLVLPTGNLPAFAFYELFSGCTSLTVVPSLEVERTIGKYGMARMFYNCTSLVNAPSMINTRAWYVEGMYSSMYENCTSLTATPQWYPHGLYGDYSMQRMFANCTSLTTITSKIWIDNRMTGQCYETFAGCTSLTDISNIWYSRCELGRISCYRMFAGCSSLTTASVPNVITMNSDAVGAFMYMFMDCFALRDMPDLPATTLANRAYYGIFANCVSLVNAKPLPAVYISEEAYARAFYGCTSLVEAPEIYANATNTNSFTSMFSGCRSLNKVILHAGTWISSYAQDWLSGVSATGDIYNLGRASLPQGTDGIPSGWTEHNSL